MVAFAAQRPGDALWDSSWVAGAGEATIASRVKPGEVVLYSSWFCPFAQRAWIACEEKGVPYKYVEVNPYEVDPTKPGGYTKKQLPLGQKRALHPGFVEASPKGLVPAIACGDEQLCESKPIVEYLDLKFGDQKLLPTDPYERAYCRVWADYVDERVQRPYYRVLIEQSEEARAKALQDMLQGARQFAQAMKSDGPYFLGARFSYVDVSFAPFWQRIISVGKHYRGIELPTDDPDFDRLDTWWQAVKSRDSVAKTIVCNDRLVASYYGYAANQATSDYAQSIFSSLSQTTRDASPLAAKLSDRTTIVAALALLVGFALGRAFK